MLDHAQSTTGGTWAHVPPPTPDTVPQPEPAPPPMGPEAIPPEIIEPPDEGSPIGEPAPGVPAPVAVRYAWDVNPICNLYNQSGLPAVPFRKTR